MSAEIPVASPKSLEDNARKFITEPIGSEFLNDRHVSSFTLIVDWLETDEDSEKKLAYKIFENREVQILLISKVTQNGSRRALKEPLTREQYHQMVTDSLLHLEKTRYEFSFTQNDVTFDMKYDVFAEDRLCMLEVDAPNDDEKAAFSPEQFPGKLSEVTGNLDYYGYRVCSIL